MNYGYFDDSKREYVITDPRTPEPWVNYLGSPEYGAIISNNGGGYSFVKSGANGRILRYQFNSFDAPGRYIYLRENSSGSYRLLSRFPDICRHGTGYTLMETAFCAVRAEMCFFVPLGSRHELWQLKLTNTGSSALSLTLSGYAEFTNNSNYEQDGINLQYSQFITKTVFENNRIRQLIHPNLSEGPDSDGKRVEERIFALLGGSVSSYCGDRARFLGSWGDYEHPLGVARGNLGNVNCYGGNGCGALSCSLELLPGQSRDFVFLLSACGAKEADEICAGYENISESCSVELQKLKAYWYSRLEGLQIKTPSKEFDSMVNSWNAYNCFITFTWSRAASFFYCGLRNGYGYRDTVQDIQGIIHLDPSAAREQLEFMLSAQAKNGGGLPLVKYTHTPGRENTPDDESYRRETGHPAWRADDALWLFPTVYKYICETGELSFLDENIPFADSEEGSVYEHLKRALQFSENRLGDHGMPAGLYADWNDCLRLGAKGESSFVAMQYLLALRLMKEFAAHKRDADYILHISSEESRIRQVIEKSCFAEDRYIRGYTEEGKQIGAPGDETAAFWLNPQTWSVISGAAEGERAELVMDGVHEKLNSPHGAALMMPPFRADAFEGALAVVYNPGMKENAGIFSQTQGWLVLAEALLGRGTRAFEYYSENCPAMQNDKAETRQMEPYVFGQFTEGPLSPNAGRSHVHWLTGTASTMMVASVEGILGIRPDFHGLRLSPSIPSCWDELEIKKRFRGCALNIKIINPKHAESGFSRMQVNGRSFDEPYIPAEFITEETDILYEI